MLLYVYLLTILAYILSWTPLYHQLLFSIPDLNTIANWADAWLVSFHAGKTFSMILSRKTEPAMHPPLTMTNTVISETQTHKHVGFTHSSKCTWSDHIDNCSTCIYAGRHGHD